MDRRQAQGEYFDSERDHERDRHHEPEQQQQQQQQQHAGGGGGGGAGGGAEPSAKRTRIGDDDKGETAA